MATAINIIDGLAFFQRRDHLMTFFPTGRLRRSCNPLIYKYINWVCRLSGFSFQHRIDDSAKILQRNTVIESEEMF